MRLIFVVLFILASSVVPSWAALPASRPAVPEVDLTRQLDRFEVHNATIAQSLEQLRKQTDINLVADIPAMVAAGLDDSATIDLRLQHVTIERVLRILAECAGAQVLDWHVRGSIVLVSSPAFTYESHYGVGVELYDVRDLINPVMPSGLPTDSNAFGPTLPLREFSDESEKVAIARRELSEAIMTEIKDTVAPDEWRDNGGTVGSIRMFKGLLIIQANTEMHVQIASLLTRIRQGLAARPQTRPTTNP